MVEEKRKFEVEAKEPLIKVTKTEDRTVSNQKAAFRWVKNPDLLKCCGELKEP